MKSLILMVMIVLCSSVCYAQNYYVYGSPVPVVQNVEVSRTVWVPVEQRVVVPVLSGYVVPVYYVPQPVYAPVVVVQQPVVVQKRCCLWPVRY